MTGRALRWITGGLICVLALAVSRDAGPTRPVLAENTDRPVTPEMREAAAELLAARRANARRQRAGEPAGWMQ